MRGFVGVPTRGTRDSRHENYAFVLRWPWIVSVTEVRVPVLEGRTIYGVNATHYPCH